MHTPQTFEVDLITFLQVQFTGVTIVLDSKNGCTCEFHLKRFIELTSGAGVNM